MQELDAQARGGRLALLTAVVPDPAGLGRIVRDGDGAVRAIVEEKDATPGQRAIREINTGVLAAPTALLAGWVARAEGGQRAARVLPDRHRRDGGGRRRAGHRSSTAADERDVRGVNDRAQLVALERVVQRRAAEALLVAGTWIADPDRFDLRGTLDCGRDVRIDVGCVFEGAVQLADGVEIGAHCVLRDVTVGAGTAIAPFSHLTSATIGARCQIGPYARMRPGAVLGEEVHIGNFVEVKASEIAARSKAEPPRLHRRRDHRQRRQRRRRHHHLQLRRRAQAPHGDRGRRLHRLRLAAGCAGHGGTGRDAGRRDHADPRRPGREAHRLAREADHGGRLAAAAQEMTRTLRNDTD